LSTKDIYAGRQEESRAAWLGDGALVGATQIDSEQRELDTIAERRGRPDRRRTRNHVLELRARHQGITLDRRQTPRSRLRRLREARLAIAQWWGSGDDAKK